MYRQFLKDAFGWGAVLWLFGYLLGIILFMLVPQQLIGWVIMPFGIIITLLVLYKRIRGTSFGYYVRIGTVWTLLAVTLDYFLLFRLLSPADGYYKIDVYLYYLMTLALPIFVGWYQHSRGALQKEPV